MSFSRLGLFLSLLAFIFFLSPNHVHCNEIEDVLRREINAYRKSLNISTLSNNGKASCLADEIANALENQPCTGAREFSPKNDPTDKVTRLVNFPKLLKECNIDANTTFDGAILPVCVPKLARDLVVRNYTRSTYGKYLKDSRFSGSGVGSEDDWMVIILTTKKSSGSFSAASSAANKSFVCYVLGLFSVLIVSVFLH